MQAALHFIEQAQVFFRAARSERRVFTGLGQRAAMGANFVGGLAIDIRQSTLDKVLRKFIQLAKIITRVVQIFLERKAQPLDHFLD